MYLTQNQSEPKKIVFSTLDIEAENSLLLLTDSMCGVQQLMKDSSESNLPISVYFFGKGSKYIEKLPYSGRQTLVIVMSRVASVQVGVRCPGIRCLDVRCLGVWVSVSRCYVVFLELFSHICSSGSTEFA